MNKINFKSFTVCVIGNTDTIAQRAIAFLYFRTKFSGGKATLKELLSDFDIAGLGSLQPSVLRGMLTKDRRTKRVATDVWMIPTDKLKNVEIELSGCLNQIPGKSIPPSSTHKRRKNGGLFVDIQRIKDLKNITSDKFDLTRLVRICEEINDNFSNKNFISVIVLTRAILNHVAPIFGFNAFSEVANNYKCERSLKDSFKNLENSSRKIADGYLHIPVRNREILPTRTQVNFSQDVDVLLGEIVRILK